MMRLTAYASGSVALASVVLVKAVHERANFFSACIYLSHNSACVIVLVNLLILSVGTFVFGLQRLLYGPLRPVEAEQLYDKAWFAITETCLAMTIFREEIGVWFIILFISLLVGKVWAWIGEGRVEIMDQQPPTNPRLFHARISLSLFVSLLFDILLLNHSVDTVRRQAKPNMMVMFAFEFAVLTTGSIATTLRYLISLREATIINRRANERLRELREQRRNFHQQAGEDANLTDAMIDAEIDESQIELPEWEDKSRWILYLELLTDFVRLVLYLIFFVVLCVFYGMPLHIIRDVALALRSFHKRLTDFVKYKRATRDMNERYPDASAEDIGRNDVCIICREPMRPWTDDSAAVDQGHRPKKLPCGHILHFSCLRRWLQWQQNCPTCRQPVLNEASQNTRSTTQPREEGLPAPQDQPLLAREQGNRLVPDLQRPGRAADREARIPRRDEPGGGGWRRFQLGPVTLDIGAWNVAQAPPNHFPAGAAAEPVASNPTTARDVRYGGAHGSSAQNQLDILEQHISGQITGLRSALSQLEATHAIYENILRSRDPQFPGGSTDTQIFRSDQGTASLTSGSGDIPPGVVIPEGWTMVPLRLISDRSGLPINRQARSGSGDSSFLIDHDSTERNPDRTGQGELAEGFHVSSITAQRSQGNGYGDTQDVAVADIHRSSNISVEDTTSDSHRLRANATNARSTLYESTDAGVHQTETASRISVADPQVVQSDHLSDSEGEAS